MNNFIEFCIRNNISFNINDEEIYNNETYEVEGKSIEITLYRRHNYIERHVKLTDLTEEGLKFEDVCLAFAKDFHDICEKVGE